MADRGLLLRDAEAADAELLREWRNDPQTLQASGSSDPVNAEQHAAWLGGLLEDRDRFLWIAVVDDRPAGQVRLEHRRGYEYEISVSVDPGLRGSGLGRSLIGAGCELLWARTNATVIFARVRTENAASAKTFEAAGFRPAGSAADGWERFVLPRPDEWAPGIALPRQPRDR